jgi:hypothetical protein
MESGSEQKLLRIHNTGAINDTPTVEVDCRYHAKNYGKEEALLKVRNKLISLDMYEYRYRYTGTYYSKLYSTVLRMQYKATYYQNNFVKG